MAKPKIRSIFDPSEDEGIDFTRLDAKTGEYVKEPSLTKQSDKDSCDINLILKRYENTGVLPELIHREPRYGDFSNVVDYQTALEIVSVAETQFGALPARIRERFNHDPAEMLAFCADPANKADLVELGLALPHTATPVVKPEQNAPVTPANPASAT